MTKQKKPLPEIKPCPFCGYKKPRVGGDDFLGPGVFAVVCNPEDYPCGATGPINFTKWTAVKYWNERSLNARK